MNLLVNPNVSFSYAGLFQSDGEWIHPRKQESTYEILYVTEGEVYMKEDLPSGTREISAKKGDLFLLSPGVWHDGTRVTRGVSFYWAHFHINKGELPFSPTLLIRFESSYLFKELLHANNLPNAPDYLVNALLLHILSEICSITERARSGYDGRAEKIYEWISANTSASLTVARVAGHFGYSPDHIARICKRSFGVGAKELINRFLLAKAKSALSNSDKYVKEIAAELDFENDKAFIAYFKYHEGCFPSEFRNRYGKIHINSK
ncbi:MAG: helix-turn-helix domain-containing protein [Ruminococcaceae bacterium]|nr:helix-turn-helix domain-containing protein [Oscillospiraceae bacterium]